MRLWWAELCDGQERYAYTARSLRRSGTVSNVYGVHVRKIMAGAFESGSGTVYSFEGVRLRERKGYLRVRNGRGKGMCNGNER